MAAWEMVLLYGGLVSPSTWGEQSDLTGATNRRVKFMLRGSHSAEFSINGLHPEAVLVEELTSDVLVRRNGVSLLRARIGPTDDALDGTSHLVNVKAFDYRELLKRRILYAGDAALTYASSTARDQEDIGWQLIAATQGRINGNLGITRGTSQSTPVTRNLTFEAGDSIGELIPQHLVEIWDGIEWEIDPGLVYRSYYPQRGFVTDFLLDYGGSVSSVSRTVNTADYTNAVVFSGGGDTPPTPAARQTADVNAGTAREGRWERAKGDTGFTQQAQVDGFADFVISIDQTVVPSYTLKLVPGMWDGPDHMWLGDRVNVVIKSGRLDVDVSLRVLAMDFDIGDDGQETISATVGQLSHIEKYYRNAQSREHRLDRLERR